MIIGKNKKEILNLLLYKWKMLSKYSAIEIINDTCKQDIIFQPTNQIKLIRKKIMEMFPEWEFVKEEYESPSDLIPMDFIELYINHQQLCIDRIKAIFQLGK